MAEREWDDGPGMLEGVRVLDLTRVVAGPSCTRVLADLGAEVFKVEPPEGDLLRKAQPRPGGIAAIFSQQNAGKRFLSVDLSKPGAVDLVLRMAVECDVFVENFRGGVADRLGVGYEAVRAVRPDVIYCSISGYGQTGPASERRSYAPVTHAEIGLVHFKARERGTDPMPEPVSHADISVGQVGAQGVLAALFNRERTGRGTHIDASMAESMFAHNEWVSAEINGGLGDEVQIFRPGRAAIVQLSDPAGSWCQIPGSPAGTLPGVLRLMGQEELLEDPRFATLDARNENIEACSKIMADWALTFDDFHTFEQTLSNGLRLPVGRVQTIVEAAETDWAVERGAIVELDSGDATVRVPKAPLRFTGSNVGARSGAGEQGRDNAEALTDLLDMTSAEVTALADDGVICVAGPEQPHPWE